MSTPLPNPAAVAKPNDSIWPIGKWPALFSCTVVSMLGIFDTLDRQILIAIFPYIKSDWGLSDTELGLLVTILSVAVALLVIPSAYYIDRWSRTKMITVMGVIWSGALLACAFATNFWHMFIARFFVGAGQAGYNPAAYALLAVQFPERNRSSAVAVYHFFMSLGAPLGLVVGSYIATHWGWRYAVGIMAVPTVIFALMALFIKDYKTVNVMEKVEGQKEERKVPFGVIMLRLLTTPSLVCVFVGAIIMNLFTGASVSWMPSYLIREGGLEFTTANNVASLAMFCGVLSALMVGPVIDIVRRYYKTGTAIVLAVSLTLNAGVIFSAFYFMVPGSTAQITMLMVAGLLGGTFLTGGPLLLIELTHPGARATVFSILVFAQSILGHALGPLLAGYLSDLFSIGTSMTLLSLLKIIGALAYILCIFTYTRDAAKVQHVDVEF